MRNSNHCPKCGCRTSWQISIDDFYWLGRLVSDEHFAVEVWACAGCGFMEKYARDVAAMNAALTRAVEEEVARAQRARLRNPNPETHEVNCGVTLHRGDEQGPYR